MALIITADTHFNHPGIMKNCSRPFADVAEMDATLIENWNEVVSKRDKVIHVGDFAWRMGRAQLEETFDRLNGEKYLIRGNHDDNRVAKLPWKAVLPQIAEIRHGEELLILSHYPLATWNKRRYGTKHLYGHVHGCRPATSQSIDVGVDSWGYRPVPVERLLAVMSTFPPEVPPEGLPTYSYVDVEVPEPPRP